MKVYIHFNVRQTPFTQVLDIAEFHIGIIMHNSANTCMIWNLINLCQKRKILSIYIYISIFSFISFLSNLFSSLFSSVVIVITFSLYFFLFISYFHPNSLRNKVDKCRVSNQKIRCMYIGNWIFSSLRFR